MADEVLNGPDMVGQLFGECQRVTYQTGDALPQGVVEALNVIGFPGFLRDGFVLRRRNDPFVDFILIRIKSHGSLIFCGVSNIVVGSLAPRRCPMAETLTLVSERVDDMPVLLAQLDRLGVPPLLDEHVPTHGHWGGLSLGWVSVLWLSHILSEGDHRLNHVAPWAKQRLHTLRECTGQPVHPLDVGDDRLATVMEALSDDRRWSAFEGALNQHVLRVYDLEPACVRLDSTTASGYWSVTEDGLVQF